MSFVRGRLDASSLGGLLLLGAALALSGPGLRAVRADSTPRAEIRPGPMCTAPPALRPRPQRLEVQPPRAAADEPEVIPLNVRGYGYDAAPLVDPRAAAARARGAR